MRVVRVMTFGEALVGFEIRPGSEGVGLAAMVMLMALCGRKGPVGDGMRARPGAFRRKEERVTTVAHCDDEGQAVGGRESGRLERNDVASARPPFLGLMYAKWGPPKAFSPSAYREKGCGWAWNADGFNDPVKSMGILTHLWVMRVEIAVLTESHLLYEDILQDPV